MRPVTRLLMLVLAALSVLVLCIIALLDTDDVWLVVVAFVAIVFIAVVVVIDVLRMAGATDDEASSSRLLLVLEVVAEGETEVRCDADHARVADGRGDHEQDADDLVVGRSGGRGQLDRPAQRDRPGSDRQQRAEPDQRLGLGVQIAHEPRVGERRPQEPLVIERKPSKVAFNPLHVYSIVGRSSRASPHWDDTAALPL
jgi:membrane protein implicated in regulation of membrane protease activity